jgi:hypothetical protein
MMEIEVALNVFISLTAAGCGKDYLVFNDKLGKSI